MIPRNRPMLAVSIAVLSVIAVLSILRSVQAHREGGREQDIREADEQLRLGIAPARERGAQEFASNQDTAENLTILNADQFRQVITEIDRLIFEDQPFDDKRRAALASRLEQLAERVKSASDTRFIEIEAGELRKLAAYAHNYPASAPRSMLENQWMRIRNNVFDDRSWFARSAADLEPLPNASTAADPFKPAVPAEGVNEPAHTLPPAPVLATHELEGRWRVRELYGNGRLMTDPEISNSVWTFHNDQMIIESRFKSPSSYTFTKIDDDRGTALRLESNRANRSPDERGWMNYAFGERDLTVAFYDGLGARPEGFTAVAGKADPMLTVVILQREQ